MKTQISRRDFLKLAGFASAATTLWGCAPEAAALLPTVFTPVPVTQDEHFLFGALKRITYGPTVGEFERAKQIGFEAFVEEQLAFEQIDDAGLSSRISHLTTLEMPAFELAALEKRGQPVTELIQATLLRAIYSRRQLYEQMVNFWSDHFNIYVLKSQDRFLKPVDDREVIRPHALGKFRDLLSASMHSPAMMVYLDNASSTKDGPNENYARELMELHTLGVSGGYSQEDVHEVARALTGWIVTGRRGGGEPGEFVFRDTLHDDAAKKILGVDFPAGQGVRDGEQLIGLLADHPSTAGYIAYKLVRHFVSDDPPVGLVSKTSATFQASGGDIREVLRTIFFSEEFRRSLGLKLKRPFEYVVSALRQTDAETTTDKGVTSMLRAMGQLPFFWPAPNGYPDVGAAWLNSNDLLTRWNFSLALAVNSLKDVTVDWKGIAPSSTVDEILNELSVKFFGNALAEESRTSILDIINSVDSVEPSVSAGALLLASPYFQNR